jgi:hypothetical protein
MGVMEEDVELQEGSDEDTSMVQHDSEEEEEKDKPLSSTGSTWRKKIHTIVVPRFRADSGARVPFSDPLDLFHLFLPYSFMSLIGTNTRAYAHSKGASSEPEELYRFLVVNICMGICVYPQTHMYWAEEHGHPFISQCFARNRFMEILRYFHINPPNIFAQPISPLPK